MPDKPSQLCFSCGDELKPADNVFEYGLHTVCFVEWFELEKREEFDSIARQSATSEEPDRDKDFDSHWNTSFFLGKFKKYSASLGDESYILKVKEDIAPELPDVEYICNQLARSLGISVPNFYLINFQGLRTFVCRNFVRRGVNMTLDHIYHYLPNNEHAYNCETLLENILEKTKRYTDAEMFVKMCLYDSLIGNHDRHGRNLGYIRTARGISLAPIYDNTSSLGLEHGDMLRARWSPRGKIATQKISKPKATDYVFEFIRLGYEKQVRQFIDRISLSKLNDIIQHGFCSALMKNALSSLVEERYEEMKDELAKKS